jgi:hypothetical protein
VSTSSPLSSVEPDYLASNCLEIMSQAITQYPKVVICSCQAIQVDEHGTEVSCTRSVGLKTTFHVLQ